MRTQGLCYKIITDLYYTDFSSKLVFLAKLYRVLVTDNMKDTSLLWNLSISRALRICKAL